MDIRTTTPSSVSTPQPVQREPAVVSATAKHVTLPVSAVADVRKQPPVIKDLQHTAAAVAEQLNEFLRSSARDLEFRVDGGTKATVITVRDGTGDIIRQIPNETALRLMRLLNAQSGTLVDLTA